MKGMPTTLQTTRRHRPRAAPALLSLLAVVSTGLPVTAAGAAPGSRPALRASLTWRQCHSATVQCATLRVPLDYAHPKGRQISLALERFRATTRRRVGSLLVNPGGPGASGLELAESARQVFPSKLLARFDIVGWDPRGVGKSAPVHCRRDLDPVFHLDYSPDTPGEEQALADASKQLAESCSKASGALLANVSSSNTARDMDRIRAALGEKKLTYLGFSYGTYLGTLYADRFPKRVRALVLDGAVDPALTAEQTAIQQAAGLDKALNAFFAECRAEKSCPFYSGGNPAKAYDQLVARVERQPLDGGGGRKVGPGEFDLGVATTLYAGREGWSLLAGALAEAQRGDGSALLEFSDEYVGRDASGNYDNSQPAFWSIGCLDTPSPAGVAGFEAVAKQAAAVAPHFGPSTVNLGLVCAFWPFPPVGKPGPIPAKGAPPILVVGTKDDPITPVAWAQGLAGELDSGHLLLTEGEGHSAFGRLNACVDNAVIAYLVSLKLPSDGLVCK